MLLCCNNETVLLMFEICCLKSGICDPEKTETFLNSKESSPEEMVS
jgi:hypothetical protein